mgnify:CR=1 FL=1
MNNDDKKKEEKHYVELLRLSLEEHWIIYPQEAPDFEVHDKYGIFGLEVTECHSGDSNSKGSVFKKDEMIRKKTLDKARAQFVIKYPHLENMDIFYASPKNEIDKECILKTLEQNILHLDNNLPFVVYKNDNPIGEITVSFSNKGEGMWVYISDWSGNISYDNNNIQKCIDKKSKKIANYKKNYGTIKLLIFSGLFYKSEKIRPTEDFVPTLRGFDEVYFYSHGYVKTYTAI